jgi:hypothetical protein
MRNRLRSETFGLRSAAAIAAMMGAFFIVPSGADAASLRVKLACSKEYYAFCSQFSSDSPQVRSCMRAAGERLSPRCLNALIAEGEVSQEEVAARRAQAHQQD